MSREKVSLPPLDVLLVGLWYAFIFGLLEVGIILLQERGEERLGNFTTPDFAWMTPVANAMLLLAAGTLVLLIAWLARGRIGWPVVLWTYGFLAVLSILFRFPSVDRRAWVILAAVIALQLQRWIAPRMTEFRRLARRSLPWLAGLILCLGVGRHAWLAWQERRGVAALPAADSAAPNVLLIILDTVRALDLSVYGYHRATTPFLERLAARGVVFEHALANAPWTLPSHASIFTGRVPHEHSADWVTPLDETHPVVAEAFAAQGYATAGFVANRRYTGRRTGLDRGFHHYADFLVNEGELIHSSSIGSYYLDQSWFRGLFRYYDLPGRKRGNRVTKEVLNWLEHRSGRPYFVFLNYYDAHTPLLPVAPYDTLFVRGGRTQLEQMLAASYADKKPSKEELEIRRDAYDGTIAYLDQQIEELLGVLEQRGDLDRTIVVVTADHGDLFGEKGATGHGNDLFRPRSGAASRFLPSRVPRGRRVTTAVSLHDLAATMLSLAGVSQHRLPPLARAFLERPPSDRPHRRRHARHGAQLQQAAAEKNAGGERFDGLHRARSLPPDPQRRWLDGVVRFPE